jgi:AraC family transcriptional regulator
MAIELQANRALGVMGDALARRDCARFSLARLRPTVPEHQVHRHGHEEMHALLLLAGTYVSDAEGMPALCSEPALIFNPPGTEHRDRFRSRDGLFLTLTMPRAAFDHLVEGERGLASPERLAPTALAPALRWLRELNDWDDASSLAVESAFAEALACARPRREADHRPGLQRALDRLDETRLPPPSVAELAQLADLHPVHFARVFRRHAGSAPGDYLRRRRVHRAIPLLLAGRSLARSAAALGFTDESHLHRSFVRELGLTPGAFRRLALGRREVARIQDRLLPRC